MASILGADGRPLATTPQARASGRLSRNILDVQQLLGWLQRPDNIGLDTYEKMVLTDETIAAGLEFITLSAISRLGEYVNEDRPDIQDFVRDNFEGMRGSMALAVGDMLCALWAGFSITEIVLRHEGGRFWLESLDTLEPRSIVLHVVTDGGPGHGQVDMVHQWWGMPWQASIPGSKVIHFANRRLGLKPGNPYGISRLKAAYKHWFLKDAMLAAWGLTMERYGTPLTFIETAGGNATVALSDGTQVSRTDYLDGLIGSLTNASGLVLQPGEKVTLAQAARSVGADFEALQQHCNKQMLRSLLVPILLLDNTDVGSYALGQKHFDLFLQGLEHLLLQVTEVLLEQLIRPLVEINFGPQASWGEFLTAPLQPEDLKMWSAIFLDLVNIGALFPGRRDDLNTVRSKFDLDPIEKDELPLLVPAPALPADVAPTPGDTEMRRALLSGLNLG